MPKFYSSLAALCHILRDVQDELKDAWKRLHPETYDTSELWRMCPKPLSGRWARKTELENFVLRLDPMHLYECLVEVLGNKYWKRRLQEELEEIQRQAEADAAEAAEVDEGDGAPAPKRKGKGKGKRSRGKGKGKGGKGEGKRSKGKGGRGKGNPLDDTANDENEAFQKNLGKWARTPEQTNTKVINKYI